jgi:hypothetical protein
MVYKKGKYDNLSVKALSYVDSDGLEKGILYLTKAMKNADGERIYFDRLNDFHILLKKQKISRFIDFNLINSFSEFLDDFESSVSNSLKSLEKINRFCELNEKRISERVRYLIDEITIFIDDSSKTYCSEVYSFSSNIIHKLTDILDYEIKLIKSIKKNEVDLAKNNVPKISVQFLISELSSSSKINDKLDMKKNSKYDIDQDDINLLKFGIINTLDSIDLSDSSEIILDFVKKSIQKLEYHKKNNSKDFIVTLTKIKQELDSLLLSYRINLKKDFLIDLAIEFDEFKQLNYICDVISFYEELREIYSKKLKQKDVLLPKEIYKKDVFGKLSDLKEKIILLDLKIDDISNWAQQDIVDDNLILDELLKSKKSCNDDLIYLNSKIKSEKLFFVDVLDANSNCYYIRLYDVIKNDHNEWTEELNTVAMIGFCYGAIEKIKTILGDSFSLDYIPRQIYLSDDYFENVDNNSSFELLYIFSKYNKELNLNKRIDIISSSELINKFNQKFKSHNKHKSNYSYFKFIKSDLSYTFKTLNQLNYFSNSIGQSSLKLLKYLDVIDLYVDEVLKKKIRIKKSDFLTKLRLDVCSDESFSKKGASSNVKIINKSKSVKKRPIKSIVSPYIKIIGGFIDRLSSFGYSNKLLFYKKSRILIDPVGDVLSYLSDDKIDLCSINGVLLTSFDLERTSGLSPIITFFKKINRKFVLISTKKVYKDFMVAFSKYFDDFSSFKKNIVPLIIPINSLSKVDDLYDGDELLFDGGFELLVKDNSSKEYSNLYQLNFSGFKILISGNYFIPRKDYSEVMNEVIKSLGLDFDYNLLYSYDSDIAESLWSIGFLLRQKKLCDPKITDLNLYGGVFDNKLNGCVVNKLIDLKIPMQKIAMLNNLTFIKKYDELIYDWLNKYDLKLFLDSDLVILSTGNYLENLDVEIVLELIRYIKSFKDYSKEQNSKKKKSYAIYVDDMFFELSDLLPNHLKKSDLVQLIENECDCFKIKRIKKTKKINLKK